MRAKLGESCVGIDRFARLHLADALAKRLVQKVAFDFIESVRRRA